MTMSRAERLRRKAESTWLARRHRCARCGIDTTHQGPLCVDCEEPLDDDWWPDLWDDSPAATSRRLAVLLDAVYGTQEKEAS